MISKIHFSQYSSFHCSQQKIRLKELYRLSAGFNQTIASDLLYDVIIKKCSIANVIYGVRN